MSDMLSLAPLKGETSAKPAPVLDLPDALKQRDDAALLHHRALGKHEQARFAASKAGEAFRQLQERRADAVNAGLLAKATKRAPKAPSADEMASATKALADTLDAVDSARMDLLAALAELELPQQRLIASATAHYEALLKDKRTSGIACFEWWADEPKAEPRCHCLEVPGNTWPKKAKPPHNASNEAGKPWCAAHQAWDCDGPHPVVSLEQFLARFRLPS